ncbi:VOC family protein [Jeotgalicoccus psychrophilus]|uniref:VOC family protein n=1 Tax=Jeotgalicoccus psychrophilus TaxID=157228 RepID=UPI001FDF8501|nr:VOC family protein [Jeotgalicoccus psychrophilus]
MIKAIQYFNYSNALEALEFYEKNFDAVINSRVLASDPMFADALDEMGMSQEDAETFLMNAEFEILGQKFMASSTWEQKEIDNSGAILAFTFDINNSDELEQVKQFYEKAIEAGCRADMEAGPTEWTEYFASFKDPYGINWMISGE